MNTNLKKLLIILIVILVIVLIGLLVYNFLIKKSDETNGNKQGLPAGEEGAGSEDEGEEEGFGPQTESKIKAISQGPAFSVTITADKTQVIYYLRSNANIWKSDFDGSNSSQVSSTNLENLAKVIWSPDKNYSITIFQDNLENISKYFYTYATNKALPLNRYINYITWSSDGKKIAYQFQNDFTDDNNVSISNPDGSKYSILLKTRMKDLVVEWPLGADIFLREKPSGLAPSSLYSLNSSSRAFNKVISNLYGFSLKWSAKGDKILYSRTDQKGQNIQILTSDRNGTNEKSAGISTLAEKCTWSQDVRIIYCAIPKNIKEAKTLPDDFYKGTFIGDDDFYKINVETGEKTILSQASSVISYDAVDLFLSPQENFLFFINKGDGLLYSIKLD